MMAGSLLPQPCICANAGGERPPAPAHPLDSENEFARYRGATLRALRRFFRTSVEIGRLPNLLGREVFPSRTSFSRIHTFEDQVIFTHDVEMCLSRLEPQSARIITLIVFQEFDQEEVASMWGLTVRWIRDLYFSALDDLTLRFLRGGLIAPFPGHEAAEKLSIGKNYSNSSKLKQ